MLLYAQYAEGFVDEPDPPVESTVEVTDEEEAEGLYIDDEDEEELDTIEEPDEDTEEESDEEPSESETDSETSEEESGEEQEDEPLDEEAVEDNQEEGTDDRVTFSPEQQKKFNEAIQARLARQKRSLRKETELLAGTKMTEEDVENSAKLYGMLKQNPELSDQIRDLINAEYKAGNIKLNSTAETKAEAKLRALEAKEVIIDMKDSDPLFKRYFDDIEAYADVEDLSLDDERSIELAYKLWKADNAELILNYRTAAQKRRQEVQTKKKKAAKKTTRKSPKPAPKPKDYTKMSDAELLRTEGLSLTVADD